MQLARAAAARTLANWAAPEEPRTAAPPSRQPTQSGSDTAPRPDAAPPPHKPTDPAVLFTRFAAVVRDCIALEARLSAGAGTAAPTRAASLRLRADPRRAPLRETFRRTIENHPDRTDLNREFATSLDEHLTADPDQTIDPGILLFTISDELGIEIDLATVPDEYLTAYAETLADPDPDPDNVGDQDDNDPDPRATSPP